MIKIIKYRNKHIVIFKAGLLAPHLLKIHYEILGLIITWFFIDIANPKQSKPGPKFTSSWNAYFHPFPS